MKSVVLAGVAAAALIAGAASVSGQTIRSRDTDPGERQGATATQPGSNMRSQQGFEGRSATKGRGGELNQQSGDEGKFGAGRDDSMRSGQRGLSDHSSDVGRHGAQGRSSTKHNRQGLDQQTGRDEGAFEGQGQRGMRDQPNAEMPRGAQGRSTARRRGGQMNQQPGEEGRFGPGEEARGGRSGAEGRSSLGVSREQESQIREYIGGDRSARVDHVDFDVRVGTVVPRSVHFVPLPPRVVHLIPRYRGYDYFIVRDEIVIIDPRTLRIVAVLPA